MKFAVKLAVKFAVKFAVKLAVKFVPTCFFFYDVYCLNLQWTDATYYED